MVELKTEKELEKKITINPVTTQEIKIPLPKKNVRITFTPIILQHDSSYYENRSFKTESNETGVTN